MREFSGSNGHAEAVGDRPPIDLFSSGFDHAMSVSHRNATAILSDGVRSWSKAVMLRQTPMDHYPGVI